jgi:hypothetical protein
VRFLTDWLEDAPNAAPEERATVADLRVYVGEQNVTMHLVGKHSEDHITLPLYPLAEGLTYGWWNLFGGRDQEFSLLRYRMGYAVPDVRMKFDGAAFEVSAHQHAYLNPDIRFWAGVGEVLTRQEAEETVADFIERVLAQLGGANVQDTSAALRWKRVLDSRVDPDEQTFCEAAGALGLDPYQIEESVAADIEKASELFEGEQLVEFLAGARNRTPKAMLQWVEHVEGLPGYLSRLVDLANIAQEAARKAPSKEGERSWALGYRRARAFRSVLGLKAGDRFRSYGPLAKRLGAGVGFRPVERVDNIRALRSDKEDGTHIFIRDHGKSSKSRTGELFAFARAVGDVACFPGRSRAVVNEVVDALRQAAGRAFAAELLAPVHEVLSMWNDGRDIQSIADEFRVDDILVKHQIENKDRIDAACTA